MGGKKVKEYIRISTGLNNYKLLPREDVDLSSIIDEAGDKDKYYGVYIYEEKHYEKWCKDKSLKGVRDVTTDKVVLDFDHQTNPEKARRDTLEAIDRLVADGIDTDQFNIYFSGNRGFHIILTLNERIPREVYEKVVDKYGSGLDTLDKTVKDQQRLIRMPFTKNQKTGLYDIPISYDELNTHSIDEIKEKSVTLDKDRFEAWNINTVKDSGPLLLFKEELKKENKVVDALFDVSKKPSWLSNSRYALKEGFFEEGERNTACMILASTYKNNGMDSDECYQLIKNTLEKRKSRYDIDYDEDELQNTVIDVVYSTDWRGGQYTEQNDLLQKVTERLNLPTENSASNLITFSKGTAAFEEMSKGWRERLITTGIDLIDSNVMIEKGMMVGLLGAPGSGKTSFALNFAEHLSRKGKATLFMSLDMSYLKVIGRMIQKEAAKRGQSYSIQKIQDHYDTKQIDKTLKNVRDYCEENYQHIVFYDKEEADLTTIETNIEECKQMYGADFNLVIIDYFEKIRGKHEGDPTTNSAHIASRLSGLAKRHDVTILVLLQPRKSAGDPRQPLDDYTDIKGSSTIQQDSRVILTMWRPGYNPQDNNKDDKYASIAVVKANLGDQKQMDFKWDGFSGTLSEMNFADKQNFMRLTEKLKRKRENENKYGKRL